MNDNFFPEAAPVPTYVDGRLAPPELARQVRRGWIAGCTLLVLQALVLVGVMLAYPIPFWSLLLTMVEIGVGAALVVGTRRWLLVPAWLLLAYPFACELINAWLAGPHPTDTRPSPWQIGMFGVALLVIFGVLVGKAALAIRTFRRSPASQA